MYFFISSGDQMHHTAEEPSIDFSSLKVKIASKMSNCEEDFPCASK